MPTYRRRSIALIAACLAAACDAGLSSPANSGDDSHGPISFVTPVEFISITIDDATPMQGQVARVDAKTLDANRHSLDRPVTWSASDTTVISVVTETGTRATVRGLLVGTSTLTATSEGKSASIAITVRPRPVASVMTGLNYSAIPVGATARAFAFPVDSLGNPLGGRTVVWSSLNPQIATVSSEGVVTAVALGSAVIRATVESKTGDATLTVGTTTTPTAPGTPDPGATASVTVAIDSSSAAVGHTARAMAAAQDSKGNVLTGKTATWSSQNSAIATEIGRASCRERV